MSADKTKVPWEMATRPSPGTRYTKDGISVDVDFIKGDEIFIHLWPKGVEFQPLFSNRIRMPLAKFCEQVKGAETV